MAKGIIKIEVFKDRLRLRWSTSGDRSPTFNWIDKEYLYGFLEDAQEDEVEAEIKFRSFVKQMLKK